jgi:hypothetical protein
MQTNQLIRMRPSFAAGCFVAVAVSCLGISHARGGDIRYNRDVRPILSDLCFACHGADSAARKADLRLDKRDMAMANDTIVPGKPDESQLIERILSDDPQAVMPPPATKKVVTAEQKAILRKWIEQGAEYEPHWSFITPSRPELPAVKNAQWGRNAIDRFVLAGIEAAGLQPAPEADKRVLARRLSLDLTGLPPAPEEVDAFVNDTAPDAYERYVDRLFDKPQWGEHRGRHWLDYARYADTHGIHFDNFREMWSYREWVINAFNRNMPFDQFTTEQLGGDLLPNRTLEQQIASGFNRCNITTSEGGTIPEEYYVLYARDRTETMGAVFMGLTVGCSACHDHKFDPVSQKEFYSLAAFFNNTTQNAMDGNVKDTPPIIVVPLKADEARWSKIGGDLVAAQTKVNDRKRTGREEFDKWLATATVDVFAKSVPTEGLAFKAALTEGMGNSVKIEVAGQARDLPLTDKAKWQPGKLSAQGLLLEGGTGAEIPDVGDYEKDQAFSVAAWVRVAPNDSPGAIVARMDDGSDYRGWDLWVEGRRIGMHIINTWPGDALKVVTKTQLPGNEWVHVVAAYDGSGKPEGVKLYVNGKLEATNVPTNSLKGSIKTKVPLKLGQRHNGSPLAGVGIQDLRIYSRSLNAAESASLGQSTKLAAVVAKPAAERSDAEKNDLFAWWLDAVDTTYPQLVTAQQAIEQEMAAIKARGTIAHVMQEKSEPAMAFVLARGEYDKRKDQVTPDTPTAMPPFPQGAPRNRLGLAQWLLSKEHPLTSRVTVNRFWQEVFGQGIVRTSGDFGITGELPSHPELLDWLAIEFREQGWDIRKLFKLMVTSSTYRQSALATPEKLQKDPGNRLLARGPRFRMDAEMVRDAALAASGLLVGKIGGPSVRPYQPDGVWEAVAMIGSNTRDYKAESGENLYRRSMYWFWKRSAPPASMEIFNAPAREQCTVRRERTNTPLQALVTLNDPQFVEAARVLAEKALKSGGDSVESKVDFITRRLISRSLKPAELDIVKASLGDLLQYYQANAEEAAKLTTVGEMPADKAVDPVQLAAWTMLTNELMNLDEVLCK